MPMQLFEPLYQGKAVKKSKRISTYSGHLLFAISTLILIYLLMTGKTLEESWLFLLLAILGLVGIRLNKLKRKGVFSPDLRITFKSNAFIIEEGYNEARIIPADHISEILLTNDTLSFQNKNTGETETVNVGLLNESQKKELSDSLNNIKGILPDIPINNNPA